MAIKYTIKALDKVVESHNGKVCCYHKNTPDSLIELLETLHRTRQRVRVVYGNLDTGVAWTSATPSRGRIGRSGGGMGAIPLLVRTSRSLGGEALMEGRILRIYESPSNKLLYAYARDAFWSSGVATDVVGRQTTAVHEEHSSTELPFTD